MIRSILAAALALALLATLPASAEEMILRLSPAGSEVTFDVGATGHDVHGSLALRSGEIRFDPETGEAAGRIEIDAASAETGNGSRDKTMHGDVLESGKYPLFVFHPRRFSGELARAGASDIELRGELEIHGARHPLTMPARVEIDGGRLSTHATFPVPYVEWGMEQPGMFLLRVAPVVEVTVDAAGTLTSGSAGGR
jgi:polyisoprenoid-binding protein YceI